MAAITMKSMQHLSVGPVSMMHGYSMGVAYRVSGSYWILIHHGYAWDTYSSCIQKPRYISCLSDTAELNRIWPKH
jgi:hypothetical protein